MIFGLSYFLSASKKINAKSDWKIFFEMTVPKKLSGQRLAALFSSIGYHSPSRLC